METPTDSYLSDHSEAPEYLWINLSYFSIFLTVSLIKSGSDRLRQFSPQDLDFATTSPDPYDQTCCHVSASVSTYTGAPFSRLPVYELYAARIAISAAESVIRHLSVVTVLHLFYM